MIIDTHVHCFPDRIAKRAMESLTAKSDQVTAHTDGTLNGVRASMRLSGVDMSVICSIATNPEQTRSVNAFAAQLNAEPDIVALGSVHPGLGDWKAELIRIRDAGLPGIKLHPEYQEFYVDDPKMFPIYEACVKLGLPIVFHAGVDLGYDTIHCTPARFRKVAERVDTSRFVLAHMGGWSMWDEVEDQLVGLDVYMDTGYCFRHLSDQRLLRMARAHGTDKILFATDSPWKPQDEYVRYLQSLPLTESEYRAIAGENAARLFNIALPAGQGKAQEQCFKTIIQAGVGDMP